ncbi:hypothetical protein PMG11_11099 [Penicillium brasilianum]|uniref:Uncharacterized protein n=1 Tax=Penicillium brasilianum TaxID=104259 RepID=A0A0F7U594_PENBI|nr:hypothetical protein PMG11_11099 [Penicillium brasilianum]
MNIFIITIFSMFALGFAEECGPGNQCDSGQCCVDTDGNRSCEPLARLGERCSTGPVLGVYKDLCPCDGGIDCQSSFCVM